MTCNAIRLKLSLKYKLGDNVLGDISEFKKTPVQAVVFFFMRLN